MAFYWLKATTTAGEGPGRGIFCDCEIFANLHFKLYSSHHGVCVQDRDGGAVRGGPADPHHPARRGKQHQELPVRGGGALA